MAIIETIKGVPVDAERLTGKGYLTPTTMSDSTVLPYFVAIARAYAQVAAEARDAALTIYTGASSTSNSIGPGNKSFVASLGKGWAPGVTLVAFSSANPTDALYGRVTAYTAATGALDLLVPANSFSGGGTVTDWIIVPGGVIGPTGATGPTGAIGATGPQGPQGVTGSGSSIHASQSGIGVTAAPRSRLNLIGNGAVVSDNPGADRIDITLQTPPLALVAALKAGVI